MSDLTPFWLIAGFLLPTAYIILRRNAVKGWYHVAIGFIACAAAAVWTFSLSEKEVMRFILDALLWLQQQVWPTILDFIMRVWSSFQLPSFDPLRAFFQNAFYNHEALLVPAVLLLAYFFTSRFAAFFLRIVCEFIANVWLRYRGKPSADQAARQAAERKTRSWRERLFFWRKPDVHAAMTLKEVLQGLNAYLALSSGSAALLWILLGALLFLFFSFVRGHQLGASSPAGAFDWTNPFAAHPQVFWLGLYIFAAELLGQLFKLERPQRARRNRRRENEQAAAAAPSLVPLYRRGIYDHAAHTLWSSQATDPPSKAESTPHRSRVESYLNDEQRRLFALRTIARILHDDAGLSGETLTRYLEGMTQFLRTPRYMIFHESLHPLHLRIIFALCVDQQARGRISLIICPEHIVKDVEAALKDCASSSLASLVQRGVVLGGAGGPPLRTEQSYSYIVLADTHVERELLSSGPDTQFLLGNLGMIVALEAQDLQVSLLRLRLPRLWLRVPREDIKVLVQVGSLANYAGLAEALLPRANDTPITWHTRFAESSATHTIVWRGSQSAARSVLGKYLSAPTSSRFSTGLSLVTYAMTGSEKAVRIDRAGQLNQSEVNAAEDQLASGRIAETGQLLASAFERASDGSESARKAARVVIVEERASVLTALAQFHDWYRRGEILLNLVTHDYPLRDYHVFRISQNGNPILADGAQMAPDPRGGVRELLSTLHDALRERRGSMPEQAGLRRSQILEQFLDLLPSKLRNQLALVPGLNGFKRLFEQLSFAAPTIKVHREEGETRYDIDEGSRDEFPELHFSIPVRVDGRDRLRVPSGDVGLTILPYQTILIEGREHYVQEINRTYIDCYAGDRNSQNLMLPVLEYRWNDPVSKWLLDRAQPEGSLYVAHYYASLTRRTVGKVTYREEIAPLSLRDNVQNIITGSALEQSAQHEQRRDYQSVLHLQFNHLSDVTELELPEFAFTTCVVLQDVVRARFPRWPHRINVVSPQAAPVFERCRGNLTELSLLRREEGARLNQLLTCIYPRLIDSPAAMAAPPDAADGAPRKVGSFDIFLIEDSDFDLGVVRQLQRDPRALVGQVCRYLDWLGKEGFKSRYHRFGAAGDSPLLLFERVWTMMNELPKDS
jgi:hypothetical protein